MREMKCCLLVLCLGMLSLHSSVETTLGLVTMSTRWEKVGGRDRQTKWQFVREARMDILEWVGDLRRIQCDPVEAVGNKKCLVVTERLQ